MHLSGVWIYKLLSLFLHHLFCLLFTNYRRRYRAVVCLISDYYGGNGKCYLDFFLNGKKIGEDNHSYNVNYVK